MGATEAVHQVFQAEEGRPLATPFANHLVPLADATVQLCRNVLGLVGGEECLFKYVAHVVCHPDRYGHPYEALDDVKKFFASFQGAVRCAHEIEQLINTHAADPQAHTMRAHPLTGYAEVSAILTLGVCEMLCDVIGIPGAITKDDKFNLIVNFDPNDSALAIQAREPVVGRSIQSAAAPHRMFPPHQGHSPKRRGSR